jgi:uncharacterized protein (TIGR02147 family)
LNRIALEPLEREWIFQHQHQSQHQFPQLELTENSTTESLEKIATWVCYAILSLIKTKDFKPDLRWIATRLDVSVHEIKTSVEALKAAKLLEINSKTWQRSKQGLRVNNTVSTGISQNFQRQLLAKALQSMQDDPMECRDLTSITIAMPRDKMQFAKEEIRKFRLKMAELFEDSSQATDVYNLTVQFVPVTKNKTPRRTI